MALHSLDNVIMNYTLAELTGQSTPTDEPWIPTQEDLEEYRNINRSRLIDFLYILGRDHLPVGTLESIMFDQVDTEPSSYCNTYLEEYARDLADRLLDLERSITDWKHMHKSADSKIKWCGEQNRPVANE